MRDFFTQSGLKFLALANLTSLEYSLILYILDAYSKGVDPLVISPEELAHIFSVDPLEIEEAFQALAGFQMLDIKGHQKAYRIDFNPDFFSWSVRVAPPQAPIVTLPASESFYGQLTLMNSLDTKNSNVKTLKRVLDWFFKSKPTPTDFFWHQEELFAKKLIHDYPVDQVLLLIDHFRDQILSLETLHKHWSRFVERFETESDKIDFLSAKQKLDELDHLIKEKARQLLESPQGLILSTEESQVLRLLIQHRHPRKQLFWAYQLRSRYQNLLSFFEENASYMVSP